MCVSRADETLTSCFTRAIRYPTSQLYIQGHSNIKSIADETLISMHYNVQRDIHTSACSGFVIQCELQGIYTYISHISYIIYIHITYIYHICIIYISYIYIYIIYHIYMYISYIIYHISYMIGTEGLGLAAKESGPDFFWIVPEMSTMIFVMVFHMVFWRIYVNISKEYR